MKQVGNAFHAGAVFERVEAPATSARLAFVLALAFLAIPLAGCLSDDDRGGPASGPPRAPVARPGSGSPESHGEPVVEEGPVDVQRDGQTWRARRTVTITNDFGGASRSSVSVSTPAGSLAIAPGAVDEAPAGGYGIRVELQASGVTEDQARSAVEAMRVRHSDALDGGTLRLETVVDAGGVDPRDPARDPLAARAIAVAGGGSVTYALPAGPVHDVEAETGAGSVSVANLDAGTLAISTGAGSVALTGVAGGRVAARTGGGSVDASGVDATDVVLESDGGSASVGGVRASSLRVAVGGGSVDVSGSFANVDASTDGGSVALAIAPFADGKVRAGSGGGSVSVTLDGGARHGYDVLAESGGGNVAVSIPDGEDVEPRKPARAHVRTRGFDARDVRTTVEASTDGGSVSVSA